MKQLACAILIAAVKDWQNPKYHKEVRDFLYSDWFVVVAEVAEVVDPERMRRALETGCYDQKQIRNAYHRANRKQERRKTA